MKCLLAYQWVKLKRSHLPAGKGILGSWLRLAARAAFRKGQAYYCGYTNDVEAGTWVGGIVGLKSILGIKDRKRALTVMEQLSSLGYITYSLDQKTKVLSYKINDWVMQCTGDRCLGEAVYATDGYGFICVPRNITQRLIARKYHFDEADAWLDLWCHTVWHQKSNAFSGLGSVVQYDYREPVLSLDSLGKRWNWEKTKVWRFFRKYSDTFSLCKLPGSFGCLIFTSTYPTILGSEAYTPDNESVMRVLSAIRIQSRNARYKGTDRQRLNQMVVASSTRISIGNLNDGLPTCTHPHTGCRVAFSRPYYKRAYFSLIQHCQNAYLCSNDCWRKRTPRTKKDRFSSRSLLFAKEKPNVGRNKATVRAAGEQALLPISRFYEIPGQERPYQRCQHPRPGCAQGQTGKATGHVP